jgi:hypothetical protein
LLRQSPPRSSGVLAVEDVLRRLVREAPDHVSHDSTDNMLEQD